MTAERMPPSKSSYLVGLLELVTRTAAHHPWPTLLAAIAAAAAALVFAAARLEVRTNRLDLLNRTSAYNQRWLRYIEEFAHRDDVVIVVEGSAREHVIAAIEDIAQALASHERLFDAILYRMDLARIRGKGLHYLSSAQLAAIDHYLDEIAPVLQGDWSQFDMGRTLAGLASQRAGTADSRRVDAAMLQVAGELLSAFGQAAHTARRWGALPDPTAMQVGFASEYLLARDGRLGFVLLHLAGTDDSPERDEAATDTLRGLLQRTAPAHPSVTIGLTGLPIMEQDEMAASRTATAHASLLSIFGVACLFAAGFGGLRHALMTVVALALGIAWSVGYATIAVGHLNILSMAFGIILVGLGIDFGIHYLARYQQLRRAGLSGHESLRETVAAVGPGVVTGGLTTSVAFFAAGLTEFSGIAELGIIAGGGILLCLGATLLVLPALLTLAESDNSGSPIAEPLRLGSWIGPMYQARRTTLAFSCCLTVVLGIGLTRLTYDHNLLNLQPVGLESVELERKLLAESDQSLWFALSIADDRETLLARKQRFTALATVARVEEIVSLLPADSAARRPLVERIHRRLAGLPQQPPQIPVSSPQQIRGAVAELKTLGGAGPVAGETRRPFDAIDALLLQMPTKEFYRRVAEYQQQAATELLDLLHALQRTSDPAPPQLTDLPRSLVRRFVSPNGRHLLRVYGRANIWNMDALEHFVQDVRRVDPQATGTPLQTYEASRQMQRSYLLATLYSLLAVTILLVLDFRSLRVALLAMLPVAAGIVQMLGLLGWLGLPLNPANMIVLPLILGIGVDDGVHVMHDFQAQRGRYRLTNSTANALLLTSLTSMVSFGSLMLASHRGLESLGRVLTIGMSCCLFSSLTTLPAILAGISPGDRRDPSRCRTDDATEFGQPPHEPGPPRPAGMDAFPSRSAGQSPLAPWP